MPSVVNWMISMTPHSDNTFFIEVFSSHFTDFDFNFAFNWFDFDLNYTFNRGSVIYKSTCLTCKKYVVWKPKFNSISIHPGLINLYVSYLFLEKHSKGFTNNWCGKGLPITVTLKGSPIIGMTKSYQLLAWQRAHQ